MRKPILIGLIIALAFSKMAYAQITPKQSEKYQFLTWFAHYKHIGPLCDTPMSFLPDNFTINYVNKLLSKSVKLSKADLYYIKQQIQENGKAMPIGTALIGKIQLRTNFNRDSLYSRVSMPIFSINKKIVFINYGFYCGSDCGKESIEVFIKIKNNKWKTAKSFLPVIVF